MPTDPRQLCRCNPTRPFKDCDVINSGGNGFLVILSCASSPTEQHGAMHEKPAKKSAAQEISKIGWMDSCHEKVHCLLPARDESAGTMCNSMCPGTSNAF
jgi:hypothetical protein